MTYRYSYIYRVNSVRKRCNDFRALPHLFVLAKTEATPHRLIVIILNMLKIIEQWRAMLICVFSFANSVKKPSTPLNVEYANINYRQNGPYGVIWLQLENIHKPTSLPLLRSSRTVGFLLLFLSCLHGFLF